MPVPRSVPYRYELLLCGVWIAVIAAVRPTGDFPINDDWAYAQNVRHLSEEGEFHFSHWPAMTLIAQTLWGALFCELFGFSFEVLRLSTLVLAIAGTLLLFRLVRSITGSGARALLAALVALFDPIHFTLSFSFMTEVHFQFFLIASIGCLWRWSRGNGDAWYAGAALLALVAVMIRQTGLVLTIGLGVAYALRHAGRPLRSLLAALPAASALVLLWGYRTWRAHTGQLSGSFSDLGDLYDPTIAFDLLFYAIRLGHLLFLVAVVLLPLLVAFVRSGRRTMTGERWTLLATAWALAGVALYCAWDTFPVGNVLYDFGLGPKLLKDTFWRDNLGLTLPPGAWIVIKSILCLSVAWGFYLLCSRKASPRSQSDDQGPFRAAMLVTVLGFGAYLMITPTFFDRYAMPLTLCGLLFLVLHLGPAAPRLRGWAYAALAAYALIDVVLVHDHFAWDRARWQALHHLTDELGIPPDRIDGGFEFNGWYASGPLNPAVKGERSWWFVTDDEYVVSSGPIAGFQCLAAYPYQRVVPWGTEAILILHHPRERDIPLEHYPYTCDLETLSAEDGLVATSSRLVTYADTARRSMEHARSGRYGLKLVPGQAFGFTRLIRGVRPGERFIARVWRHQKSGEAGIVLQANSAGTVYEFSRQPVRTEGEWALLEVDVTLPPTIHDDVIGIYVWAQDEREAWLDDLWIHRLPAETNDAP